MKLEDQVTSLELSKKLKELGIKQESYLFWSLNLFHHSNNDYEKYTISTENTYSNSAISEWVRRKGLLNKSENITQHWDICNKEIDKFPVYSAFTVAELLNMLQVYRKEYILVPVGVHFADYLAQEIINEKSSKKN